MVGKIKYILILVLFCLKANAAFVDSGLTDDELRASPVVVSGIITSGTTSINNFPSVYPSSQSGVWSVGRTWNLSSGVDSVTSNIGTTGGVALDSSLTTLNAKDFATQTTLALIKAKTDNLDVALSTRTKPADTQIVSGTVTANLGSIAGVATAANQTTANASLSSIDNKLSSLGVSATQQGTWTTGRTWNLSSGSDTVSSVVTSSALPAGAATSANQTTTNSSLSSIDSKTPALVSGRQPVDGSGVTQPISAASLPLPTGAATAANQTTANNSLSSIDTKLSALSVSSTIISSALPTGASTAANQTTANTSLASIDSKLTSPLTVMQGAVTKATYSAASSSLALALLSTDVFTITGSATKTIKVTNLEVSCVKTAAGFVDLFILRRSTANTGGTSTTLTDVTSDTTNAAATATVLAYTANPTTGTLVGNVASTKYLFTDVSPTGSSSRSQPYHLPISLLSQPQVLRGTSQVLAVNFGGVTAAGGLCDINVMWTEE